MNSLTEVTVLYEGAYWIALIEDYDHGQYSVARTVIGTSEPTGAELISFFDKLNDHSLKFTSGIKSEKDFGKKPNFKRRVRESRKKQSDNAFLNTYTKAHAMLKIQLLELKNVRRAKTKIENELIQIQKFQLRQHKKKEKHKGH